jgi:hypothetical protein
MIKKVVEKINGAKLKLASATAAAVPALMVATCHATDGTTPSLDIAFDVAECFSWAQTIISAMLPVVYITMGVSLGFLIIRAFKSAFNG